MSHLDSEEKFSCFNQIVIRRPAPGSAHRVLRKAGAERAESACVGIGRKPVRVARQGVPVKVLVPARSLGTNAQRSGSRA
ncbi:hypothetical protein BX591_10584 [Paraburkholderia bryophila]|uniref:Uncharacterized protein n=1 Tax=Paraburkholderia bryophila TaxID=420952 RepID=A0A329CX91_9BURK|nr:hypothetical protein BX591_10584 [Paraburkholderia bryophila]